MNELRIFENVEVGIIVENGEPLFEVYSTGMALGQVVTNAKGVAYPNKERINKNLVNAGITPCLHNANIYISEEQLYDLMFEMKTDKVKKFRKWVTFEVLPSIRKHGAYITPAKIDEILSDPDTIIKLATDLKAERERRKMIESTADSLRIHLDKSKQWYSVKRVAKLNGISWKKISWRKLIKTSEYMQIETKKIFDANYGEVNAYHIDVWRHEYPELYYA